MGAAKPRFRAPPMPGIGYDPSPAAGIQRRCDRPGFGPRPVEPTGRGEVSARSSSDFEMAPLRGDEMAPPRGDEPATRLEELVREYGHVILGAVRKAAGTRLRGLGIDAEDVVQSVLLEVWKQVRREQEIRHPSSYLYRAAVRETVRLMERVRNRQEDPLEVEELTLPAGARDELGALELRQAIDCGLGDLLPDRRKAVGQHLAGYRVLEIMQRYDWSYSRARNLIARGMADLRHRLRAMGVER